MRQLKVIPLLVAAAIAIAFSTSCAEDSAPTPEGAEPAKPISTEAASSEATPTSTQPAPADAEDEPEIDPAADAEKHLRMFGWAVAKQTAGEMELSEEEVETFMAGFREALTDDRKLEDRQSELQAMAMHLQMRMMKIQERESAEAKAASATYFKDLREDPDVKKAASGLHYKIIEAGDDQRATKTDQVTVHYTGTLIDGTEFDSSRKRGEPATFPVAGVVPGFSEGVQLIGKGGRVMLYIPSDLGYGSNPRPGGPIPPDATLIFDVEMIDIEKDATPPPPTLPKQ